MASSDSVLSTTHMRDWLDALPLTTALARAFKLDLEQCDEHGNNDLNDVSNNTATCTQHTADTTLQALSELSDQAVDAALETGWVELKAVVKQGVQQLRRCLDKQKEHKEKATYKKFCEEVQALACGSVKDFHQGLIGRVGESETIVHTSDVSSRKQRSGFPFCCFCFLLEIDSQSL